MTSIFPSKARSRIFLKIRILRKRLSLRSYSGCTPLFRWTEQSDSHSSRTEGSAAGSTIISDSRAGEAHGLDLTGICRASQKSEWTRSEFMLLRTSGEVHCILMALSHHHSRMYVTILRTSMHRMSTKRPTYTGSFSTTAGNLLWMFRRNHY